MRPLGFDLSDARLRRAGLDYHDLARVTVHNDISAAWVALGERRVFAFSTRADTRYTDVAYRPGDALMFGSESVGLPDDILADPHVTRAVRIPMLPGLRSMNLSNCAAVAVYEAWRQQGFDASR